MKIVILSGASNCGKTTTLNKVYDFINPIDEKIIRPKSQLGADSNDFECIVKYKNKKIAFYTMGDFSNCLVNAFEKYDKERCDILICACNNSFKRPYQRVKTYSHSIIDKNSDSNQNQLDFELKNNSDKEKIVLKLQ